MSDDTVIAPATAGDEMSEADASAAFDVLSAAKSAETETPAVTPEPAEETPAAPAAVEVPAKVPAAAAPAAAATDIWSSATPELRAAHEAALAQRDHKYTSDLGRQTAHQARIRLLEAELATRAAPAAAPATPAKTASLRENPAIQKALVDYPETGIGEVVEALDASLAENALLRRDMSVLTDDRRAAVIATQEQALTTAHPDWRTACGSKDFADWLTVQPKAIKDIVERNGQHVVDAEEAIAMVGNFKAHYALTHPATPQPVVPATPKTPAAPANLDARRQAQLAAVTTAPKGGPTGVPEGAPGGDEKAVFDSFVLKKAKRN